MNRTITIDNLDDGIDPAPTPWAPAFDEGPTQQFAPPKPDYSAYQGMPPQVSDPSMAAMNSGAGMIQSQPGCIAIFDHGPSGNEIVRIMIVGDQKSEVVRRATEFQKRRFPSEYARFMQGVSGHGQRGGTPLHHWAAITQPQVLMFNAAGCYTIEDVANVSDGNLVNLGMGGLKYREMAQDFVAQRSQMARANEFEERFGAIELRLKAADERASAAEAENRVLKQLLEQGQTRLNVESDAPQPTFVPEGLRDHDSADGLHTVPEDDPEAAIDIAFGKAADDMAEAEAKADEKPKRGRPRKTAS